MRTATCRWSAIKPSLKSASGGTEVAFYKGAARGPEAPIGRQRVGGPSRDWFGTCLRRIPVSRVVMGSLRSELSMSSITSDLERKRIKRVGNREGRRAPRKVRASFSLLTAILAVACSDSQGPTAPGPATPPPASGPAPVASVTLIADSPEVAVAGQRQLQATVRDGAGSELPDRMITWASSDPAVASVDADGLVSGVALGSATVTATAEGVSGRITIDVRGFLIGPLGGKAMSADGLATANVPPEAVEEPVVITVEPAKSANLPQDAEMFVRGSAYEFGPSGVRFSASVELTIRYYRARVPANISESSLGLGRVEGGFWTHVAGGSLDSFADEVHGEVTGFSIYGAIGVPRDLRPTATISAPADGSSFAAGTSVTVTGTGTDPEDGALSGGSLAWTSDRDHELGTGESMATSGLSIGTHTISLTVTDSDDLTDRSRIKVTITNNLPTATITAPAVGSSFAAGTSVTFEGRGPIRMTVRCRVGRWSGHRIWTVGSGRAGPSRRARCRSACTRSRSR